MGGLDDLQRQLSNAQAAAEAERLRALAEQQQRRASGQGGQLPPSWPKPKSKIRAQGAGTQSRAADAPAGEQAGLTQRVGGRLQRVNLEKTATAPHSMPPTAEDFRRKVDALRAGEPESLGALPVNRGFDLGLDGPATTGATPKSTSRPANREPEAESHVLTFGQQDIIRAVVLGGILGEPKGRGRQRRPR
jgi:hypothetical protein